MVKTREPYFMTNEAWYYYDDEEGTYKLTDEAPKEARESYEEHRAPLDRIHHGYDDRMSEERVRPRWHDEDIQAVFVECDVDANRERIRKEEEEYRRKYPDPLPESAKVNPNPSRSRFQAQREQVE